MGILSLKSFLSLVLLTGPLFSVQAALFTDPKDLPRTEYDFIVIGAGTAGNVVASRLSEDSSKSVLVVEAGLDDADIELVQVPFFAPTTPETLVDWNYTTVPQPGINGRSLEVPRGFVLGGSSSLNYMIWTQASRDLFDSYANVTGDKGWGWDEIQPLWKKVSTLVPALHNPTLPPPPADDPNFSNGNGPVQVNFANVPTDIDFRVINASKELEQAGTSGGRFKFTADMNTGDTIGFGLNQETAGGGQRSSSSTAYLRPALERPNLDVLVQTRAMRLVETDDATFTSVEVAQRADGPITTLNASSEIIVSAGAIGTPHLLLLSGIGPKDELEQVGVESKIDLTGVGKNLVDHPLVLTYYRVSSNSTFDDILRNNTLTEQTLELWEETPRSGLFTTSPTNVIGFMRIPQGEGEDDPSTGPTSAHTEILFTNGFSPIGNAVTPEEGHYITVVMALVSPKSKGSLTLTSSENGTFTYPAIDYGLLSNDWDLQAMMQALRDADTFLTATPWTEPSSDPYIVEPVGEWANAKNGTDKDREDYIRNNMITVFHPIGTAKMSSGSPADPEGVTDARLRVRGVKGVRVVDASIFPTIPECHPQAPIYTIAERAAQMIKEDFGMA